MIAETGLHCAAVIGDLYPERRDEDGSSRARPRAAALWLPAVVQQARYRRELAGIRALARQWTMDDAPAWQARLWGVRARLLRDGLSASARREACAAADVACRHALGITPYDSQWLAALAMLDGRLVEMATGEGKTLSAGLAAAVAAMAGVAVHVLTANDYLVRRDAAMLEPLYALLGLRVGAVCGGDAERPRREAYRADIVHATAREVVFDYLRDEINDARPGSALQGQARSVAGGRRAPLLRGLQMALLDEADSILLDEARVPLILSVVRDGAQQRALLWQSAALAGRLAQGTDFRLLPAQRQVELTAAGRARLAALGEAGGSWLNARHREETVSTALAAKLLYQRGRDYLVRDDEIVIIDPVTGRTAEGRQWSRGLHGLIALREGCPLPPETDTLNQITYQRFFPRYLQLGGMSGSLREVRSELADGYGLALLTVPLRLPSRRTRLAARFFADHAAMGPQLVARVRALQAAGRAVLIGTASVAESQRIGGWLAGAGLAHRVLNAEHNHEEAAVIAAAGQPGSITVATNMAGRGTDIALHPAVAEAGGLHVLSCQLNPSRRLDRQLAGRCARQGDPGSVEHWLCAADFSLQQEPLSGALAGWLGRRSPPGAWLRAALGRLALSIYQYRSERRERRERARLLSHDQHWDEQLVFGARRVNGDSGS